MVSNKPSGFSFALPQRGDVHEIVTFNEVKGIYNTSGEGFFALRSTVNGPSDIGEIHICL